MRRLLPLLATLAGLIEFDEVMLLAGLTLITVALWPASVALLGTGRPALLVPGVLITWIALPQRASFIARPPAAPESRRER